jgi:hypothetical protein
MYESLVSVGYYAPRLVAPPDGLSKGLLPSLLLTLTSCLTDLFPDSWALEWVRCSDDDRTATAARFGVPASEVQALVRTVTELYDTENLGWPNVWYNLEAARRLIRETFSKSSDIVLVGAGIPSDFVAALLHGLTPAPREGPCGAFQMASAGQALVSGGEVLGWEVLGFDSASCHSWLCNGVHVAAAERLGVQPGKLGLLDSEQAAREVIRMMAEDPSKAEPAAWVPTGIVRYAL